MGFLEEPTTSVWEDSTVLEIGGTRRCREEEHDGLEMMAKQSKWDTGRVGEAGRTGSGWRDGEEQVEGDLGGKTEGRRGFHGEPLCGRPLWRGMRFVA